MRQDGVFRPGTREVLGQINAEHGRSWRLEALLEGGHSVGAFSLRAPDRSRAVLKWEAGQDPIRRVLGAPDAVAHARAHGYPTPAWLAWGATSDGVAYHVQEFLPGKAMGKVRQRQANLMIELVARQVGIGPSTGQDWARLVHDLVYDSSDPAREKISSFSSTTRRLLDVIERAADPFVGHSIPSDDLVHGDLSPDNLLVHGGGLSGVVDAETMGRGPAVFDLLCPVRNSYLWGHRFRVGARLQQHAFDLADGATVMVCAAAHVMKILGSGITEWPEDVDRRALRSQHWISDVHTAVEERRRISGKPRPVPN
ncbi:MAG: phosphotransferase [Actinomycetota bacterium]|nr:phosphotransferase [Actinomycetota bacterium]